MNLFKKRPAAEATDHRNADPANWTYVIEAIDGESGSTR